MCFGITADEWGIAVRNGVAEITRSDVPVLSIPVVTLVKLYREGMLQHHREKAVGNEADQLARQYGDMMAQ
jgi:hypothetical protein